MRGAPQGDRAKTKQNQTQVEKKMKEVIKMTDIEAAKRNDVFVRMARKLAELENQTVKKEK